jgi:hypothetical protein
MLADVLPHCSSLHGRLHSLDPPLCLNAFKASEEDYDWNWVRAAGFTAKERSAGCNNLQHLLRPD